MLVEPTDVGGGEEGAESGDGPLERVGRMIGERPDLEGRARVRRLEAGVHADLLQGLPQPAIGDGQVLADLTLVLSKGK